MDGYLTKPLRGHELGAALLEQSLSLPREPWGATESR